MTLEEILKKMQEEKQNNTSIVQKGIQTQNNDFSRNSIINKQYVQERNRNNFIENYSNSIKKQLAPISKQKKNDTRNFLDKTSDVLNSLGWGLVEGIAKPTTKAVMKNLDQNQARYKTLNKQNPNMSSFKKYTTVKQDKMLDDTNNILNWINNTTQSLSQNEILKAILLGSNKKINNENTAKKAILGTVFPENLELNDKIDERENRKYTSKEIQNIINKEADAIAPNKTARTVGNIGYEGVKMGVSKLLPGLALPIYGITGAIEAYGETDDPNEIIAKGAKDAAYGTLMRGTSNLAKKGLAKAIPGVGEKVLPTVAANFGANAIGGASASAITDVGSDLITGKEIDAKQIGKNALQSGLMSGIIGGTTDTVRDVKLSKVKFNKDVKKTIENLQNINKQIVEGDASISKNPKIINRLLQKGQKEIGSLASNKYLMQDKKLKETVSILQKAYDTGHIDNIRIANKNLAGLLGTAEMNLKAQNDIENISQQNDTSKMISLDKIALIKGEAKTKTVMPINEEIQSQKDRENFNKQLYLINKNIDSLGEKKNSISDDLRNIVKDTEFEYKRIDYIYEDKNCPELFKKKYDEILKIDKDIKTLNEKYDNIMEKKINKNISEKVGFYDIQKNVDDRIMLDLIEKAIRDEAFFRYQNPEYLLEEGQKSWNAGYTYEEAIKESEENTFGENIVFEKGKSCKENPIELVKGWKNWEEVVTVFYGNYLDSGMDGEDIAEYKSNIASFKTQDFENYFEKLANELEKDGIDSPDLYDIRDKITDRINNTENLSNDYELIDKETSLQDENNQEMMNKKSMPISDEIQLENDIKDFSRQVDDIDKIGENDSIKVLSMTPKVYQDLGLNNLPMTITKNHTLWSMEKQDGNTHKHGIEKEILKQIPDALTKPLNIVESGSRSDSIVAITELSDKEGNLIIVPIKVNGRSTVNEIQIDANVITSIYGKDKDYDGWMKKNKEKDRILYDIDDGMIKKYRSNIPRLQLPNNITSTINNIIPSKKNYVNNAENTQKSVNKVPTRKTMNPIEIANLSKEDISSTPKIELSETNNVGNKKSSFYDNITNNSKFINKELRSLLKNDTDVKYYKGITNEETLTKAKKRLDEGGQVETLRWANKEKDFTPVDVAEGWILLKRYQDIGDIDSAIGIVRKMRNLATTGGQMVQAFNIMNRLTPEGMMMFAQSELDDAFQKFSENKTQKWIDENKLKFQLTSDETQFIKDKVIEAQGYDKNSREQKVALAEIQKVITDKLPAERGQKVKSWMRISMLFNPKTQTRNVAGNALIAPVNYTGDIISSMVDKAISKKTGVRTTGNINVKAILKGLKKGAYEATNDFRKGINTKSIDGNRFEISQGKSFSEKNVIGKSLNRVEALLNYVMDIGDRVFSESWFENSLQNQMILNDTTEITQEMIDIATQEALSRTWNDNNNYTKFVLDVRKTFNKLNIGGYGLGDVLIPFAKTPANLTKAIVDYSPVGLVSSIIEGNNLKKAIERGDFTAQQQHKFVQDLGKATVGTLLYVVGYALAKAGITTGSDDDDKDVANFMRNTLGVSSYSIKIGDKTFTYDWAQPLSTPFSVMADIVKLENSDANLYEKVLDVIDTPLNNILEQSFMSSIQSVLTNRDNVAKGLAEAIEELPARAIPTFVKQIADMVDGTSRQTYLKGKPIETAVNKVRAKIPFVSKTLAPTVDTLGRESKKYGGNNGVLNVFFNPANFNTGLSTKAGEEIYKLYKKTGDKTIMPRVAGYSVTYKGANYNLSTEERAKYQKVMGEYTNKNVEKVLSSKDYQSLNDIEKADIINEIISDGAEKAKEDFANTYNKNIKNEKEKIEYKRSDTDIKIDELVDDGLNVANAYIYKTIVNKIQGDKDKDGKSISGSESTKKVKYIYNMKDDDSQKDKLLSLISDTDTKPTMSDLKKLNGEYLTYMQQSGKKNDDDISQRDKYMMYVDTGIPVATLNKYYDEIGKIEGQKDSNGKTISGSKKKAIFNYINSLPLNATQKKILFTKSSSSYGKNYKNEIFTYINNLKLSKKRKEEIWKELYD